MRPPTPEVGVVLAMLSWERPAFGTSFELWREDGILHLVFRAGARITTQEMKELLRLSAALDPADQAPVLVECQEQVVVEERATTLLRKACVSSQRSVALLTQDLDVRLQGEVFKRLQRPSFPFRLFAWREDAHRWVRERKQLAELGQMH